MNKTDVKLVGGFGNKCNKGTQYHEQNRIYDSEQLATAIPSASSFHPNYTCTSERERESKMRIRKLTPLECLKLMSFEKQDYDAIKTMSDSRVYHMAGDSIVVSCLMGLFGQLLPISEEELLQAIREYTDSLANKGD